MTHAAARAASREANAVAVAVFSLAAALVPVASVAAEPEPEDVLISAARLRPLDESAVTASRLGLSVRETPGTLDAIDADQMLGRGYVSVEQAASSLPGVTVGGSPGNLMDFSMRGFTGAQVVTLQNGLYLGPSNMTNRPGNSFNLERIEVLKGPASVLYGQGAIGGAVNTVTKRARLGASGGDLVASVGRFGTLNLGIGGGGTIGERAAWRVDVSRTSSDGFVDDAPANSLSITSSVRWQATEDLEFLLSFDVLDDEPSPYFGTPLVSSSFATQPLSGVVAGGDVAIDRRMRYLNFNVADYRIDSTQYWPQLEIRARLADGLTLHNVAYWFSAERNWINSEVYDFDETTRLVDRDRFFVLHDQELYGDIVTLSLDGQIAGRENRLAVGAEYSRLDFVRGRGFPDGDSVDPLRPSRGRFGPLVPRVSPTSWDRYALFFEDVLEVSLRTKIVLGGRTERIDLDRRNFNPNGTLNAVTSFRRDLDGTSWRVGIVHDAGGGFTPYLSFTTGQDPVGANIFLVNRNQSFDLADARQAEAGVKYEDTSRRLDFTAALYDIRREDILTQVNSAGDLSNVGDQRARGAEFAGNWQPVPGWTLSGSLTYTDARYGRFFDPDFGIEASGNTPANVPEWTSRLWTSVARVGGLPLELGGGVSHVGTRQANSANTLRLPGYLLVDAYASWHFSPDLVVTARANNLFDEAYTQWADVFYPTSLLLGPPRRWELGVIARF